MKFWKRKKKREDKLQNLMVVAQSAIKTAENDGVNVSFHTAPLEDVWVAWETLRFQPDGVVVNELHISIGVVDVDAFEERLVLDTGYALYRHPHGSRGVIVHDDGFVSGGVVSMAKFDPFIGSEDEYEAMIERANRRPLLVSELRYDEGYEPEEWEREL